MLFFIGTLHSNLTPHDELITLIEGLHPSHILIEITQRDIDIDHVSKYPDEMQAALTWAKTKSMQVYGIDSDIKTLKTNISDAELKKLDVEQTAITKLHDWKEFNKPELYTALQTATWRKVIDHVKDDERSAAMSRNIVRCIKSPDTSRTVVVTGSGHIPFFRNKFPDAEFPLSEA